MGRQIFVTQQSDEMPEVDVIKALANERRLRILDWLKDPGRIFRLRSMATWSRMGFVRC